MPLLRMTGLLAIAAMVIAPAAPVALRQAPHTLPVAAAPDAAPDEATFSVMTYNVKGLPWPVASGRALALERIGDRLADLRSQGAQPHVVLLQEAFSDAAEAVAQRAGYAHVVRGPTVAPDRGAAPLGRAYAQAARWDRGEGGGSLLDSGLLIMSDYPVLRTRRMAFAQGGCAGFDCLASKGVAIAWIEVPGLDGPVAVVDTHLNSRGATHVAPGRADAAYAWQVAQVRRFLADAIAPDTPVIFGGDFNIGQVPARLQAFAANAPLGIGQRDALSQVAAGSDGEAAAIIERNKDRLLYRSAPGSGDHLVPVRASVPFPLLQEPAPLSDHAGFTVGFAID